MSALKVGNKIKMCDERKCYTIQAFDERFIIATKPYFKTYLYTLIDRKEHVRGTLNALFGLSFDVDNPIGANNQLQQMRDLGGYDEWHVSRRNYLPLTHAEIMQIEGQE